jgi:hypothetical protein
LDEPRCAFGVGKHLTDKHPICLTLSKKDILSSLFSNFTSEYAIRKVQKYQVGNQLSVCAVDVRLLGHTEIPGWSTSMYMPKIAVFWDVMP